MTRARHRWIGFSFFCVTIALLATELPTSTAIKATSLIFSKTSSTTTSPTEEPNSEEGPQTESIVEDEAQNSTKKLTGIPQIDYLLDPNLPRELNGYNLSEYPFYETVPPPETMDFKCDGLHDGFYASVPHKCQVYHHCLFGTRYDFLCANYTAFDQKTFICHFVSEVDCKNSPNYFSRNEALYKATTTAAPPPPPTTATSTTTTTTTTATGRPARPPRRRPAYAYDYYDDDYYYPRDDYDYEDRRRPRPRPARPGKKKRPVDDYEDDRYERRPRPRDEVPEDDYEERRPYDRRPAKRPYDRRPYEEDEDRRSGYRNRRPRPRDEEEERYRPNDEDRPRGLRDQKERPKYRPRDEFRPRDEVRSRPREEPKDDKITFRDDKRDDIRARDEIRPRDELRPRDEIRSRDEIRPRDETRLRDEKTRDERRPLREEVDKQQNRPRDDRFSDSRRFRPREERPYLKPERNNESDDKIQEEKREVSSAHDPQVLVKPSASHSLFSQPRKPPKIKRPVPANERGKYDYKTVATTKAPPKPDDDEYYDYEEDETSKPSSSGKTSTVQRPKIEPVEKEKFKPARSHLKSQKTKRPDYEEYYEEPKVQKYQRGKERYKSKSQNDYYDYEDPKKEIKKEEEISTKIREIRPKVKVIKRPFLPSRGGSPHLPRGLQPVAGRDILAPIHTTPKTTTTTTKFTTTSPTTTKITTTVEIKKAEELKEEYDYYDEDDIDYDKHNKDTASVTATIKSTTVKTSTSSVQAPTSDERAKNLASKVLKVYNDNYAAIQKKLESTLSPGDYIKPYLATALPLIEDSEIDNVKNITNKDNNTDSVKVKPDNAGTTTAPFRKDLKLKPEVSKPYTATGKPFTENISVKQNLADSLENDYDIRLNEALTPNLPVVRAPSGFVIQSDRDYTFSRFRNNLQSDPQFAASDISSYRVRKRPLVQGVSIRTPTSYYLQPQRVIYSDSVQRYPRQLYRQLVEYY